jgi:hypothetical protein
VIRVDDSIPDLTVDYIVEAERGGFEHGRAPRGLWPCPLPYGEGGDGGPGGQPVRTAASPTGGGEGSASATGI